MSKQINLINAEPKRALTLRKVKRQARRIVAGLLVVFIISSVAVLVFYFNWKRNFERNQGTILNLKKEITSLDKNESYLVTIANRVSTIRPLLEEKDPLGRTLSDIETLFVPGFDLTSLEITGQKEMKMYGFCKDLATVTDFNEHLEQLKLQEQYKGTYYPEIYRLKDGNYIVTIGIKK